MDEWARIVGEVLLGAFAVVVAWLKFKEKRQPIVADIPTIRTREDVLVWCHGFILELLQEFATRYKEVHRVVLLRVTAVDGELWGSGEHVAHIWGEGYDGELHALRKDVPENIECDPAHVGVLHQIAQGALHTIRAADSTGTLRTVYRGGGVVESDVYRVCNGTGLVFLSIHYTKPGVIRDDTYWLRVQTLAAKIATEIRRIEGAHLK